MEFCLAFLLPGFFHFRFAYMHSINNTACSRLDVFNHRSVLCDGQSGHPLVALMEI